MPPCQVFVLYEFQSSLISGMHSTGKLSAMCFKFASPSDVQCSNSIWACFHCVRLAEDEACGRSRPPLMPCTGKTPEPGGTASLWSLLGVSSTPKLLSPPLKCTSFHVFPNSTISSGSLSTTPSWDQTMTARWLSHGSAENPNHCSLSNYTEMSLKEYK